MNSSDSDKITLADIALLVALQLKGNWTPSDRDCDRNRVELIRNDGMRLLFIDGGNWAPVGKIHVMFCRPRDAKQGHVEVYGENRERLQDPSINVSEAKPAEQIARDIERRLLPDAEKVFSLVNADIKRTQDTTNHRLAVLAQVCAAAGVEVPQARNVDEEYHYHFSVSPDNHYPRAKINYDGSVSLEIGSLSPEKAIELIRFLRENTFAAPNPLAMSNEEADAIAERNRL